MSSLSHSRGRRQALVAWRRLRVRLWLAVERKVRTAYDALVDAEER